MMVFAEDTDAAAGRGQTGASSGSGGAGGGDDGGGAPVVRRPIRTGLPWLRHVFAPSRRMVHSPAGQWTAAMPGRNCAAP